MKKIFLATVVAAYSCAQGWADIDPQLVARLKPQVVNLETRVPFALNDEGSGKSGGTGFIVDAAEGIIATNKHVAGTSPTNIKVSFFNGKTADAVRIYYDITHDFAFLKVDVSKLGFKLEQVVMGDSFLLKEQDEVFYIGNDNLNEYSVREYKVDDLYVNNPVDQAPHGAVIRTSGKSGGGSSGSPVFNKKGEAVAVHFAGDDNSSLEYRIEYIKDALKELKQRGCPARGVCGAALQLAKIDDLQKYWGLSDEDAAKMRLDRECKQGICVDRVIPLSPAEKAGVMPGDVLLGVNNKVLGDNLYMADKLMNDAILDGSKSVELNLVRSGKPVNLKVAVEDAENHKIRAYALFAGGTLQDLTPELRRTMNIQTEGVYLVEAKKGTVMQGLDNHAHANFLVIERLGGEPTPNLEAFIKVASKLKEGEKTNILARDFHCADRGLKSLKLSVEDLEAYPLKVYDWSKEKSVFAPRAK